MIENLPFIKFSPAVSPEIETTNTWLLMAKFCAIPEEYEKFLRYSNGCSYNGLNLYGCSSHYRENKNYKYPSLQEVNQNFKDYNFFNNKLVLGNWNESLIYYDKRGNYYALADRINLRSRQEFETFEKLFSYLMEQIFPDKDED